MQRKAAFVCCSDSRHENERSRIMLAAKQLEAAGIQTVIGKHIFTDDHYFFAADARTIAKELMYFYSNPQITDIFDISGGDIANGILPYLDYDIIAKSNALFWGYSDLTTVINSIYQKTGKTSVLYQIKNIAGNFGAVQTKQITEFLCGGNHDLFRFDYRFINGKNMSGIVIGGNIRCFLKLAGTPYMPDLNGKILLLEALGGTPTQIQTYVNQLLQIEAFDKINGILLGTFTKMEESGFLPTAEDIIMQITNGSLPIAKSNQIGHGSDSKAIMIGHYLSL